jgi:two-component system OmpR family response regulator
MPVDRSVRLPTVLLVEDEPELADEIRVELRRRGYEVRLAPTRDDGLRAAREGDAAILILDRMLHGEDGLSILAALRDDGIKTPVLVISALAAIDERIRGLKAGGDDYLVKPFAFSELLARVEALLRRGAAGTTTTKLRVADLELDLLTRSVKRGDTVIDLLPREFQLLEYLMRNTGHVVTRTMLLEHVWDYHFDPQTNVIDVHVSRLRQKIDRNFDRPLIHTVRGAGYCLRAQD